jgi:hypothetical protein
MHIANLPLLAVPSETTYNRDARIDTIADELHFEPLMTNDECLKKSDIRNPKSQILYANSADK